MKTILFLFLPFFAFSQPLPTLVEQSGFRETPTYYQVIDWWRQADRQSAKLTMLTMGPTDSGFPLHLVLVSATGDARLSNLKGKTVILINNGIHPGEPDGIDASMLLVRDILSGKKQLPGNIVLAIIPVYNIGGCLNRSENYRVDQNGPAAFGFRGNGQNLDLNRDFIKADSRNARSFAQIFQACDPLVFVDNHVSNGADYQHVITLLTSQYNKLGGAMGSYLNTEFEPGLYASMKRKGYDLVPYVNHFGETPDSGWPQFMDYNRYSSGYATLFQCFGFTPETHMLKPYEQRVKATYALMESFIDYTSLHEAKMKALRREAREQVKTQAKFPLTWSLEKDRYTEIKFKGFEAGKKPSDISGLPRLYYDRNKPYEKKIRFFNFYAPETVVDKPRAYIIPQGWWKVIELLKLNGIAVRPLEKDTMLEATVYHITDFRSMPRPYEMHHPNSEITLTASTEKCRFRKGDIYIPLNQAVNRFIIEVLEPQAPDSYFAWNYFDAILGQKEGFSSYVFEDTGAEYLKQHPDLQQKLAEKKISDTAFAKNAAAQLEFIYRNSPYFEPDYRRYPVVRLD